MLPENHVVFHMDNVHGVIRVVVFQVLQNLEFYTCLIVVLLLVLDNFYSDKLLSLVIEALDGHSERPTPQMLHHLVPIGYLVFHYHSIVALCVIISAIRVLLI